MNKTLLAFFIVTFAILGAFLGCDKEKSPGQKLPQSVVSQLAAKSFNIDDPMFQDAKLELEEAVRDCGPGVVKGNAGGNKCAFQIEIDSIFMRHPAMKTGLLHDDLWAYRDGNEWITPRLTAELPDSFDLRDLMKNGVPEIKTQMCGDCWAWATHHGYELVQAIHDGKVVDAAVQAVLSCSKQGTCSGGYMTAVDFMKNGIPDEQDFPYKNGVTGKCKYTSDELATGWVPKVLATPRVGSSLNYSRAMKTSEGFEARPTVAQMKAAIYEWKSPLVVTVSAYSISGDGVYNTCGAINSPGNHMVVIIGWEKWNGKNVALVWNSWGKGHGKDGVSRILWECGDGKLNRGLGVDAKIVQYKPACQPPDVSLPKSKHTIFKGTHVKLGAKQPAGVKCQWSPSAGVENPKSCETFVSPNSSTEYHLQATNDCGTVSAMTMVEVWGPTGRPNTDSILTPTGFVKR